MEETVAVLVTCGSEDQALTIGRVLVEERLAACVNLFQSVRSLYRWEGKLCDETEWLLVVKTRASLFSALEDRVTSLHSYVVPEIIAIPITKGHGPYLQWILDNTLTPARMP
jgi:periplasmic divalent cation tolerance protein